MSGFGSITAGSDLILTSVSASSSITIGGGTPVTKMKLYSVNFTAFNSISGNSTSQQSGTFAANSFSGMSTNDTLFVNGLGAQWATSPIVISSITASAAGPLFTFRNTTSSAATPPLGIYKIFAITT